jgi:DNA ligase-1
VPRVIDAVSKLPVEQAVFDGEFFNQVFLFDLLHVDGEDLLDTPLAERAARLEAIVPHLRIPAVLTTEPKE